MCCQQIGKKNGIHGTDICIWYIAILKNGDIKCLNSECINRRSNGNDIFFYSERIVRQIYEYFTGFPTTIFEFFLDFT